MNIILENEDISSIILEDEEILDISTSLQNDFLKGDKGDRGIQGEKGDKGETGDTGPSNTLVIGTVEKGEEASATITGESPNQILNLILPKGEKGDKGDIGETGPQGEVGLSNVLTIGTVEKGDNPEANITGESPNQVLNLVLPKGDKGDKGDTGEVGPSNILTIGTVERGEEASASIGGESPNQVLNLILPKGDKGDTGEKGDKGDKGDTGESGVYLGVEEPNNDANVWINPEETPSDEFATIEYVDKAIGASLERSY